MVCDLASHGVKQQSQAVAMGASDWSRDTCSAGDTRISSVTVASERTMKEAYAVRRTVPPSAEIPASIDKLMSQGRVDDPQKIAV
jgi:hypothetical protein